MYSLASHLHCLPSSSYPSSSPSPPPTRAVSFTGEASEAVHYALHYLDTLVRLEPGKPMNGFIREDEVLHPCLELPDVFVLLHHANHVSPVFALEAAIGGLCSG